MNLHVRSLTIAVSILSIVGVSTLSAQNAAVPSAVEQKAAALEGQLLELQAQGASRADDPAYYFELGNLYTDLSRRQDAEAAYRAALEIEPEYVEAMVNLGSLHNEQGDSDKAIELLTRASELRPGDALVRVNLGDAYYSKSQYYEAMSSYRKALEIDPGSHEAHYQIGVAFADAGIYREAIREWEKVIEIAPDSEAAQSARDNISVVENPLAALVIEARSGTDLPALCRSLDVALRIVSGYKEWM